MLKWFFLWLILFFLNLLNGVCVIDGRLLFRLIILYFNVLLIWNVWLMFFVKIYVVKLYGVLFVCLIILLIVLNFVIGVIGLNVFLFI